MKNDEKLMKIVFEIYREMYKKAEPSADFDSLCAAGVVKQPNWFLDYYLNIEVQKEIVDKYIKKYKLDRHDRTVLMTAVFLGGSPSGYKKTE